MLKVRIKLVFLLAAAQVGGLFALRAANQAASALPPATHPLERRSEVRSIERIKDLRSNQSKASQSRLIADINSSTPAVRTAAIEALVQRGDPGPALVIARLVQDPDLEVASQACWAIGELRDRRASPQAVIGLQQQTAPIVRANCALALGRMGTLEGASALNVAALNEREDIQVRLAAIQALAMTDSERASSLSSLMGNADPRIRASAAYSACQLQLPSAIDAVKAMLASSDPDTKGFGILAAGLWPEKFAEDLAKIAANSDEPLESRLLGLTAMEALPGEQKAEYAKLLSPLLKPKQPSDIQLAAVQILSEVPAARRELERIAKDGRRAPELLDRLNEVGIQTAAPVSADTYPVAELKNISGIEVLLTAVVGAALVLLGAFLRDKFRQKVEPNVDRIRKKLLMEMLDVPQSDTHWRDLETLMRVIGADEETTTRLLVELGARGSEAGNKVWALRKYHPLKKP